MRCFFILRKFSRIPVIGFFFSYLYRIYNIIYSASIPLSVKISESNIFPHGIHGVFISIDAEIGENNTIYHQVTIGKNQFTEHPRYGAPVIGNSCLLGVGAKIIGNVRVDDDVYIGANAVVVDDVPQKSTVVCSSSRVIKRVC